MHNYREALEQVMQAQSVLEIQKLNLTRKINSLDSLAEGYVESVDAMREIKKGYKNQIYDLTKVEIELKTKLGIY